jgi:hypothetical protein
MTAPLTGALLLSLAAPAPRPLDAQGGPGADDAPPSTAVVDRRVRFTALGAVIGASLAGGYWLISEKGDRAGRCQPINCALPYLSIGGAISGLFMARELDALKRVNAPRAGESYRFTLRETALPAPAADLVVGDTLVAAVSDSGAHLFPVLAAGNPRALRRRATGLSGLRAVALVPATGRLLVGSGTSLWELDPLAGPATRALEGAVDALASADDATLSATGTLLRLRTGTGAEARVDSLDAGAPVRAVAWDAPGRTWWIATDSTLVEVVPRAPGGAGGTAPSLAFGRRLPLPAPARAIAADADWIAVALGDQGVAAWRRASLGGGIVSPIVLSGEPRFAYDLTFHRGDLYVAGGVDGLYRVALEPVAQVLGSSRQLPFATIVRSDGEALWVGDRGRGAIVRVTAN